MGGREAIRGFAIQTLSVLLDALTATKNEWIDVTIEPDSGNEKVDVLWTLADGSRKAQQVKSSENQITNAMVTAWAGELKASKAAHSYQLVLSGPVAQSIITTKVFGGVDVPRPLALDTLALLDQAVTKLDRYLEQQGVSPLPLLLREAIVALVIGKLIDGSVRGTTFTRKEIDGWMLKVIMGSYPQAVTQRLSANCEVLWSEVQFHAPALAADRAFELLLPLAVANGGPAVAVIEWFVLEIFAEDGNFNYLPRQVTDLAYGGRRSFREFAVMPNSVRELDVVFRPDSSGTTVSRTAWRKGSYRLQLYVKYRGVAAPRLVKEELLAIDGNHLSALDGSPVAVDLWRPTF